LALAMNDARFDKVTSAPPRASSILEPASTNGTPTNCTIEVVGTDAKRSRTNSTTCGVTIRRVSNTACCS
jgi:hypothetical protein